MHSSVSPHGGDLKADTVNIIGATLDLQDKTVLHAMTPIDDVFMLHIDEKLDYETLKRTCATGHSRIPVYEEVEVNVPREVAEAMNANTRTFVERATATPKENDGIVKVKVKRVMGILLVKQCVLLDPEG